MCNIPVHRVESQRFKARARPAFPLSKIELLRGFLQQNAASRCMELDFGIRPDAEFLTEFLGDRDLTAFANFHTYQYDS